MRVEDGPNDPDKYRDSSLKIVHLLKQPTEDNPSFPKLVQRIVREDRLGRRFMYRLALRSYGLLHAFAPWEKARENHDEVLGAAFLATAVVNLEKEEIATSTSQDKTDEFARRNLDTWHQQIIDLKPRIVVCGGTFNAAWRALAKPDWCKASTGMEYFRDKQVPCECIYMDAPHPSARYPLAMVHTYLMASARELLGR